MIGYIYGEVLMLRPSGVEQLKKTRSFDHRIAIALVPPKHARRRFVEHEAYGAQIGISVGDVIDAPLCHLISAFTNPNRRRQGHPPIPKVDVLRRRPVRGSTIVVRTPELEQTVGSLIDAVHKHPDVRMSKSDVQQLKNLVAKLIVDLARRSESLIRSLFSAGRKDLDPNS